MKYYSLLVPALVGAAVSFTITPVQATGMSSLSQSKISTSHMIGATDTAVSLYEKGLEKYRSGDLQGALADFDEAIRLKEDFVFAYVNRGNVKDDLGNPEAALLDYEIALRYEKSDPNIYYNRGLTYSRLKQYEKAMRDYDRAIELNPEYAPPYSGRGVIKFSVLNDKEGSLQDLQKAIDIYRTQGEEEKAQQVAEVYKKINQ